MVMSTKLPGLHSQHGPPLQPVRTRDKPGPDPVRGPPPRHADRHGHAAPAANPLRQGKTAGRTVVERAPLMVNVRRQPS